MKHSNPFSESHLASIEMIECDGEWFVRVIEEGVEKTESFDSETAAATYAESERRRLGLKHIQRF